MSGQLQALGALLPGEESPVTNSVIGWVGPRDGLDDSEKENSLTSAGSRTTIPRAPTLNLATIPTEVS